MFLEKEAERPKLRDRSGIRQSGLAESKESVKRDVLSWRCDLAKLNLKCHMNYSIIFTEICFSSETSSSPQSTTLAPPVHAPIL